MPLQFVTNAVPAAVWVRKAWLTCHRLMGPEFPGKSTSTHGSHFIIMTIFHAIGILIIDIKQSDRLFFMIGMPLRHEGIFISQRPVNSEDLHINPIFPCNWGWFKGSNMIVCALLVSNSRGCCLAAPGDHEGAARLIARRRDNTLGSLPPTIHTQSCLIAIIT